MQSIDADEIIGLAKDLIRFQSFSGQETAASKFLGEFMTERGLEVELQEVESGRFQSVGRLRGTGSRPTLMFNGHVDVDPLLSTQKRDPWKPVVEDGRLYGHGIGNMKAGVVSMIMAAVALKKTKTKLEGNLVVAPVVGELQGGVGTDYLVQKGVIPDYAVVTEPTYLNVRTFSTGCLNLLLHTIGISGSSPTADQYKYVDAVEKMLKVMAKLEGMRFTCEPRSDLPGLPKLHIGGIIGGVGRNYIMRNPAMIPDFCTIVLDIRMIPGMTHESVREDLERVLREIEAEDPDISTEIEMPPGAYRKPFRANKLYMPPCEVSKDDYIVQAVRRNHHYVTGRKPDKVGIILPHSYYANDTAHLSQAGAKCVVYGPTGPSGTGATVPGPDGTRDQFVKIDNMIIATKVLALAALDVCTRMEI